MKQIFSPGSKRSFTKTIGQADIAAFDSGVVHEVYATFAITRDAEWAGRLFVLEMKDEDEEGIGTLVFINHYSPALIGEEVTFEATIDELYRNVVGCTFTAHVGHRLIASGRTGQKIMKRDKLEELFDSLRST